MAEKPGAISNEVTVTIDLTEPAIFLQGSEPQASTSMLRGALHVKVTKRCKIKAISLKFTGKAVIQWSESISSRKTSLDENHEFWTHTWPLFDPVLHNEKRGTNADQVRLLDGEDDARTTVTPIADPVERSTSTVSLSNLSLREAKRLSLTVGQYRSPTKDESQAPAKGYRVFLPGYYIYSFEHPLDNHLPESINVESGSVKYELVAEVARAGAFKTNVLRNLEVPVIRVPAEGSLETVEPIAISRMWEDQLHYDIIISGKSFPLGSQVPVAFKLTPLAKVQCHRIRVLLTESVEYYSAKDRVHRHRNESPRKIQLFEKRADSLPTSAVPGSTLRITAGGGVPHNMRARAARGESVMTSATNIFGDLEGNENVGPTEMEFNVQLPSCKSMKRDPRQRLHPDTTYENIVVRHWIKILLRLSRADEQVPGKRRHFEIAIDSPLQILSCRATQANMFLPAYSSPSSSGSSAPLYGCGCPDARRSPEAPPEGSVLALPSAAHIPGIEERTRPVHLLRAPSYQPPAFDAEAPPPMLMTPPPNYADIASPTHGLEDYFGRMRAVYNNESDDEGYAQYATSPGGRVNVPLTPGGRVNRSMEISRAYGAL
ncbi:hypothetical protein K470DRAFT_218074 [Piedraia hortae CBS 480.64]|uniref:Arrestin C-terminal-like domain-containing protein n=1 Tax=Piedraia hortae CBS 480.64 TaxID=1314780 RepID=A0A6A7BY03_9PEZI|nr:hypothetical protein K470DRAFT_218074 [Piedraia hortae CBS 480.64]